MAVLLPSTPTITLHQIGPCKFIKYYSLYDDGGVMFPRCSKVVPLTGFNGQSRKEGSSNNNPNFDCIFAEVKRNCTNKLLKEAMEMLSVMDQQEIPVHSDVYASLLEACAKHRALAMGKRVHKHMLNNKIIQTPFLWSKLVYMYVQCGSIKNARLVFEAMGKDRTVFSCNTMIAGYVTEGMCRDALALYSTMKRGGLRPDKFTFPRVIKACGGLGNLQEGKEMHHDVVKRGLESDVFIANALMDMYAKCGCIEIARELFDKMPHRDIVSWNTIIAGCVRNIKILYMAIYLEIKELELIQNDQVDCDGTHSPLISFDVHLNGAYFKTMSIEEHWTMFEVRQHLDIDEELNHFIF